MQKKTSSVKVSLELSTKAKQKTTVKSFQQSSMGVRQTDGTQITINDTISIPSPYGDFSTHRINIGLTIPMTADELANYAEVFDRYYARVNNFLKHEAKRIQDVLGCADAPKIEFKDIPEVSVEPIDTNKGDTSTLDLFDDLGPTVDDVSAFVSVGSSITIPRVYGDYSSKSVNLELTFPIPISDLHNFESIATQWHDRIINHLCARINQVCEERGQKPIFS